VSAANPWNTPIPTTDTPVGVLEVWPYAGRYLSEDEDDDEDENPCRRFTGVRLGVACTTRGKALF